MLWTDSYPIAISDISRFDQDAQTVASAEKTTVQDALDVAYSRACSELLSASQSYGGICCGSDVTYGHLAALLNTGLNASNNSRMSLHQIVSSSRMPGLYSPLQNWLAYLTLEELYRKAFSRQVNPKYEAKLLMWRAEAERTWNTLFDVGIPVVTYPLIAPAARFVDSVGTWAAANISPVVSAGPIGGSFDFAITWLSNETESHPSERATKTIASGNIASVSISTLTPPTGVLPSETTESFVFGLKATHWNVYTGSTGGTLYKQNASPIPIATTSYDLAANPVLAGTAAGRGQQPDTNLRLMRMLHRA